MLGSRENISGKIPKKVLNTDTSGQEGFFFFLDCLIFKIYCMYSIFIKILQFINLNFIKILNKFIEYIYGSVLNDENQSYCQQ